MHELSVALSIVDGVLDELQRRGASHAQAVHLRLGPLSGVDKESLLFSYGIACQETPLANSQLLVEDIDVTVFCANCGRERPAASFPVLICADCGTLADRIVHGDELEITALELDD
jgi:hydrogenase nickel incorporation protein HypA/HybF